MSETNGINWISRPQAARLLGINVEGIVRLVKDGNLSARELPGTNPRVREDEVKALADRYTRPARTDAC